MAEPWEKAPGTRYEEGWFPGPFVFPDPFDEGMAFELMSVPLSERSAIEQAAVHLGAAYP